MTDTIIAIIVIVAVVIGLPVLILWLRDRTGRRPLSRIALNRMLGSLALFMGITIIGWVVYNQFHPTEEFRRNNRSIVQLLGPIAMIYVGWKWLTDQGPGIEETPPDFDCDELRASVGRARANMHWFLDQVERNVDGAFIKFPIETPNGLLEHIWAYVHSFREGSFNVSLANDPFDEDQESSGRRDVRLEDVEDWQIMYPDGRIKGAYSLIALFENYESSGKKLTPKMRKQKAQLIDADQGITI